MLILGEIDQILKGVSSACRVSCLSRLTPACIDDLPDGNLAANHVVFQLHCAISSAVEAGSPVCFHLGT